MTLTTKSSINNYNIRKLQKKIIIIGEGGIGKTSLFYRYINKKFLSQTKMTIGSDIFVKKLNKRISNQNFQITMLLWDFAGQNTFRFLLKDYSRGAEIVLLAFDLVRIQSLECLNDWILKLEEFGIWGKKNVKYYLVGLKKDLKDLQECVPIPLDFINQFKNRYSLINYFETSSATNEKVVELFDDIATSIIDQEEIKFLSNLR